MTESPIAAARALLPWWVPWGNLLLGVPVAFLATAIAARVAWTIATAPLRKALRAGPLDPQEHARLAYPLRRVGASVWFSSGLLLGATSLLFSNALSRAPGIVALVAVALASWCAPRVVLPHPKRDPAAPRATPRQQLRIVALLVIVFFRLPLAVAMAAAIGVPLDATAWVAIGVGALLFGVHWTVGIGVWLRLFRIVRPATERLRTAVALAAERNHAPPPAAFELDAPFPYAFAIPGSRCVVATTRTQELFDERELAAICTHEVAHLTEGWLAGLGRNTIDLLLLILAFLRPIVDAIGYVPFVLLFVAAVLVVRVIARWTAARGEARADAIAHAADAGSGVYVAALEKLHREMGLPLAMSRHAHGRRGFLGMVFGRGGVHGSFAERAAALGVAMPGDARPPSRWRGFVARLGGVTIVATTITALLVLGVRTLVLPLHGDVERPVLHLALGGDVGEGLVSLAPELARQGRSDDAVRALEIAHVLTRRNPWRLFVIAERLANLDQADAARAALADARARLPRSPATDADLDDLEPGWSARIAALEEKLGTASR